MYAAYFFEKNSIMSQGQSYFTYDQKYTTKNWAAFFLKRRVVKKNNSFHVEVNYRIFVFVSVDIQRFARNLVS